MSTSGYTLCPCCGYDTVSDDADEPELCPDCEQLGCDVEAGTVECESAENPNCVSIQFVPNCDCGCGAYR